MIAYHMIAYEICAIFYVLAECGLIT